MTRLVLLDSGPLGILVHQDHGRHQDCQDWAENLRRKGTTIQVPAIIDYEIRRELIRLNSGQSLAMLDRLCLDWGYLPLSLKAWRLAAEMWANARILGVQTSSNEGLDGDVILCAQAQLAAEDGADVWIATGNIGHIRLFIQQSFLWHEILP